MEENNKKTEVEVLDLTSEIKVQEVKVNKSNKLLAVVFVILVLFIIFLPDITSFFENLNLFNKTEESNTEYNKNLYNGFVQIGIDSYMTVSNIKFFNFAKKTNNSIEFNYTSKSNIENIKNISIGVYNKAQELVATYKFDVTSIEKGVVKTFKINLSQENFIKATYAKAILNASEENVKTTMNCTYDSTINNVNLYYEIKYYFNNNKLYKYDVNKNILYADTDENDTLKEYKQKLSEEYDKLSKTNLTNISKEDLILKYSIDISSFDKKDSDYSLLYELNTTKEVISNSEEKNEWVCE